MTRSGNCPLSKGIRRDVRAALAALVAMVAGVFVTAPAHAEDPSFLSVGVGYYDFLHEADSAEFRMEYRNSRRFWIFKPFAGTTLTSKGAFHGYAGVLSDFYFGKRIVVSPSVAAGPYFHGGGKDLGHVFEIRSALEVAYRFDDRSRLGLMFYHVSNAGFGDDRNPGAEVLSLTYSLPFD